MSKPERFISFPCKIFSDKSADIEYAKKSIRNRSCQPEAKLIVDKILEGIFRKTNKAKIINIAIPNDAYAEINLLFNEVNTVLFDSYGLTIDELKSDSTLFDPNCYFSSSIKSKENLPDGIKFVSSVGSVHREWDYDVESGSLKQAITLQRHRYLTISHTDFFKLDNFKNKIFGLLQSQNIDCAAPLYSFHLDDFLHKNNLSGCILFTSENEHHHFSLLCHPDNVSEIKVINIIDDFSPCKATPELVSNINLLSKVSYEIDSYFIDKAHKIAGRSS